MPNTSNALSPRWRITFGVSLIAALLFVGVVLFASSMRSGHAAPPEESIEIRYLGVSGDGSQARTWYDGAPPAGVPVQDALDFFAKQGFRVSEVTQRLAVASGEASVWTILMERIR